VLEVRRVTKRLVKLELVAAVRKAAGYLASALRERTESRRLGY
jgi:hypothetical protein